MAADKLVDSTALNANLLMIANAIRTKGGTTGTFDSAAAMAAAIAAIPSSPSWFEHKKITFSSDQPTSGDITLLQSQSFLKNNYNDDRLFVLVLRISESNKTRQSLVNYMSNRVVYKYSSSSYYGFAMAYDPSATEKWSGALGTTPLNGTASLSNSPNLHINSDGDLFMKGNAFHRYYAGDYSIFMWLDGGDET